MSKDMSLDDVVDLIDNDPAYAQGRRESPRRIVRSEALQVIDDIFTGCDQADETIPAAAKSIGVSIACTAGCEGRCCEALIMITLPEAIALVRKLDSPEMAQRRSVFVERLITWQAKFGERANRAALSLRDGEQQEYLRLTREHGLQHEMCPFIEDGRCQVYDSRPIKCRYVWVAETWEYCRASEDPNQPDAQIITHQPYEDFHTRVQRMVRGLQSALGHGVEKRPLPIAVLEALALDEEAEDDATRSG